MSIFQSNFFQFRLTYTFLQAWRVLGITSVQLLLNPFFFSQGKPTEASKEQKTLAYGEIERHDFIAGAEVLLKMDEEAQEQGKLSLLPTSWCV